jgi:hypothetical protein
LHRFFWRTAQDVIAKQTPLNASVHNFAGLQGLESVRQDDFSDPKIGLLLPCWASAV